MRQPTTGAFHGAGVLLQPGVLDQLRLAWRLLCDDRVLAVKFALPALLALYAVSPVDTIPDFLLGVGQVDDIGVFVATTLIIARLLPRLAPQPVVDEHLREMGLLRDAGDTPQDRVVDVEYTVHARAER